MSYPKFQHIDLSYLYLFFGAEAHDIIKDLLISLLQEIPEALSDMEAALKTGNLEQLGLLSHKFKSTLHYIGNRDLQDWNIQLEDLIMNREDIDELQQIFQKIQKKAPFVLEDIRQAIQNLDD